MSLSLSKKRRIRENQDRLVDENGNDDAKRLRREQELCLTQTQSIPKERCGKIMRIHLQNFMCHGNLMIDFHDRVNFLVGSNGSGKSAIMAALVLGLGSKARATNRSGSMKQFIKTGERSTKIEITFSNAGPQAYEPEVYGDSITVTRNILQGSSNLTVKNEAGHIVSKKLDDLNRILVYHNMQVDNPVFVLNQDSAREFLKELDPHKNYRMFLKATQMELISEKLYECLHSHKEQQIRLQFMKKKIIKIKEELQGMQNKMDMLMNMESLKDQKKVYKLELAWSKVNQHEQHMLEFLTIIEDLEKQQVELQRGAGSRSTLKTQLNNQISEFKNDLEAKQIEFKTKNDLQMSIKTKVNEVTQKSLEISSVIDSLKKKKSFNESSIVDIQNHIEQRAHTNIDEMKRKNELILNEHRRTLEENLDMLATTKRDMKMFIDSKSEKLEHERQLKEHLFHISSNSDRLRSRISSINPSAKDKLAPFGNEIIHLVAEIEKYHSAGKFSKKPCGPIGSYIKVPKSKYRNVIESQLGSLVKAFIVNDAKDRLTLETIIKRVCPQLRCTIITTKFQDKVYDVRNGRVQAPHDTQSLMDEIRCSDPNVMNCLIDRLRIETILLTDNVRTAEQLSSQRENVPVNMSKIIVPDPGLEYYPEPKYRIYSVTIKLGRYIQVDPKQQVAALEREFQDQQRQKEKIQRELQGLMAEIQADEQRITEKRRILQQQENKQNEVKSAIAAIDNIEYPEHNELNILKRDLETLHTKISDIDAKLTQKKVELNDLWQDKERLESDLTQQTNILRNIQREIDDVTQSIDQAQGKLRKIASTYNETQKAIQDINEKLTNAMREKEAKEQELKNLIATAEKLGERVSTEREDEDILNDIARIEAKLRQRSNITENVDDLRNKILEKTTDYEEERSMYERTSAAVKMLGKSLAARFAFTKNLKQHMVLLLQYAFNYLLKARDFVGSVEVDHKEQTLVLSVIPRDNHLENALSSTRALSGGERSYSTVAFLVALWSCVDHPFYFLDEYDVFTDVVNRDCLTKLLVNEGKVRPDRQYTFLTPQDMALASNDIVKIHRLARPS